MTDRPIRILLDASAIAAFCRGSVHVGEPMSEVLDEGAVVGLPLLCLIESHRLIAEADLLHHLVARESTVILAPAAEVWRDVAAYTDVVGRMDAASAAVDLDASLLTTQPELYSDLPDGGPIISAA
ncbi:hypothetical protein J2S43_006078 [Catenuloplanes nepalensis]|uniref:PIN domain-containing protein n=1 Tax=Catenuloplanes nepalensis TaxID=587533 RepID=A0ABT9N292_9ACTN|nr:hypothetical protein [Catenuloplanes nepalensis]MDP9797566.1 hypothetical protein [Catenuloplanes nepalensis]